MSAARRERVAFVNPPSQEPVIREYYCTHRTKARYFWQPIDLVVLSARVQNDVEVGIFDCVAEGLSPALSIRRLQAFQPDAVVALVGFLTLDEDIAFLETLARTLPGVRILGTGDVFLDRQWQVLERHAVFEAGISSFVTADLVAYLRGETPQDANGYDAATAPVGMMVRAEGEVLVCARATPPTFSYPTPPHDRFPQRAYNFPIARHLPFLSLLTTYGCPYRCSFCNEGEVGQSARPLDEVMEELRWACSAGYREVRFRDNTFGSSPHTDALLEAMRTEKLDLSWSCLTRAEVVRPDLLEDMKAAGCHTVFFGVESGSQRQLVAHKPGLELARVEEAFRMCRQAGIRTLGHFLFGLPGETEKDAASTLHTALRLEPDFASFSVFDVRPHTILATEIRGNEEAGRAHELARAQARLWQGRAMRRFYGRPSYLLRMLRGIATPQDFRNAVSLALSLLGQWWISPSLRTAGGRQARSNEPRLREMHP